MKKLLFATSALLLLIGAGCKDLPEGEISSPGLQVQADQPGVDVRVEGSGSKGDSATATPDGTKDDAERVRSDRDGAMKEPGEDAKEGDGDEDDEDGASSMKPPVVTPPPVSGSSYTMAQVKAHASASSCWSAVGGSVYDLSAWIKRHPGGSQAILSLCGIDGTAAFNAQHGGQSRPASELAAFKIGTLVK